MRHEENLVPGQFICTSHCEIEVHAVTYTVLRQYRACPTPVVEDADHEPTDDSDSEGISGEHTLPFKVLGTCFNVQRQNALEETYEYLTEYNRPVFVKLVAEPENVHDQNAIAVYIASNDDDFRKVGYIASELTQYIHPILTSATTNVTVERTRFRTTYLRVGFYLTINITKRGMWNQVVLDASKKVR